MSCVYLGPKDGLAQPVSSKHEQRSTWRKIKISLFPNKNKKIGVVNTIDRSTIGRKPSFKFPAHPAVPTQHSVPTEASKVQLKPRPDIQHNDEDEDGPRGLRRLPNGSKRASSWPNTEKVWEETQDVEAGRKNTATPILLEHAVRRSSSPCKPSKDTEDYARRKSNAYVPRHAASDFSKINILPAPQLTASIYNRRYSRSSQDDSNSTTTTLASQNIPRNEANAKLPQAEFKSPHPSPYFENFTFDCKEQKKQTQQPHYRSFRTRVEVSEVSKVMNDLTATHHANTVRRQSMASQQTIDSKGSRRGSVLEKVGSYIKPERRDSAYSQGSSIRGTRNNSCVKSWNDDDRGWAACGRRESTFMPTGPGWKTAPIFIKGE